MSDSQREEKLLLRQIAQVNRLIVEIEMGQGRGVSASGALAAAQELQRVEAEIRVLELHKRLKELGEELNKKIVARKQYAQNLRQQLQPPTAPTGGP